MAEFLIKAYAGTTYDIGDVVVIQEDGWQWGTEEDPRTATNQHFYLIKIPGLTLDRVRQFMEANIIIDPDPEAPIQIWHKREWYLDVSALKQPIRNQLLSVGAIDDANIMDFRSAIKSKVTGEPDPNL